MFFGLMLFFVQLVKKFPIIHDAADRGIRCGCNLDKIQIPVFCQAQSLLERQNTQLFFLFIYYSDLSRLNPFIDPMGLFLSLTRMKSPSSDD
jgi:hypothetical protein